MSSRIFFLLETLSPSPGCVLDEITDLQVGAFEQGSTEAYSGVIVVLCMCQTPAGPPVPQPEMVRLEEVGLSCQGLIQPPAASQWGSCRWGLGGWAPAVGCDIIELSCYSWCQR